MRKILLSFLVAAWTFTPIGASAQTINNLGAGTTVTGSDLYPSYQGSNPAVSVTATQLQTFMGTVVQTGPGATGGTCNPGATCTIQTQEIPVTVTSGNITTAISGGLYGELINYNSASDQTPTIPTAASAGNGTYFELCGIQHSQTVTHSSSDTIGGASTYLLPTGTEAAPSCVGLRSDGVSNWNPIPYGGSSGGSGNALFGTTTGNTSGDLVSMSNTTVGVQDSGIASSNVALLNGATFTGPLAVSSNNFGLSGAISAATWTTNGVQYKNAAATLTDTTAATGTTAAEYSSVFGGNTIAATNSSVVFTNYYDAYFKQPAAGTNVTLTHAWGVGTDSEFVTGAGSAAAPSLAVGASNTGFYQASGEFGITVGGTTKADFNITNSSAWTFGGNSINTVGMNCESNCFIGVSSQPINIAIQPFSVSTAAQNTGTVTIATGGNTANSASGTIGNLSLTTGGVTGTTTTESAGNMLITLGNVTGGTGSGGSLTVTLGTSSGGSAGQLKFVNLTSGAVGTDYVCYNSSGNVISQDTTCTTSVKSTKNAISVVSPDDALTAFDRLPLGVPIWSYKEGNPGVRGGLYADDVEKMAPECAVYEDGKLRSYDDRCVLGYLVAVVQEQQAQLLALTAH